MPTVELFFDAASESQLRGLWERFASFGVPFMRDSGARPHITLFACDSVDVTRATSMLDRFAAMNSSVPICLASFGLFPGPPSVAFLAAKVTSDLLALHARFFTEFSALAAGCSSLYSPEQWIPHCTLAPDWPPQHLGLALDACRSLGLPLSCVASEVGLIEYWPCRQLYAKSLVTNRKA